MINFFTIVNLIVCTIMSHEVIFSEVFKDFTAKDKFRVLRRLAILASSYTILGILSPIMIDWLINLLLFPLVIIDLVFMAYLWLYHFND